MALLAESSFLEVGSNNWAIAPDRTIMGGAIMCNDPHLITSKIPGPMYPFGLVTPEFRAVGCCIPGIPGIIIGRTGVMPGFTNKKIVTMRWSPFETMQSVTGLENLVMCKTVGEVRKELGKITIAMLKFVFADSNGGIAWQTTGRLPVRSQGESIVPYDAELLVFLAEQDRIHGA